jgi:2,4-dienoyl-CoA reductase-like NADH-dependent reductase (Old Yellow Enzyme family)
MVESVNLSTDRIIPHFQNLADAMHKHGAKIMIQITHMGRRSRWDGFNWPTLMSPSGIREPVHRATCKTIEPEEIWRVIGNYAQAARRAKAGGLDGVELSAVHQHMIDQFWSPRVNKRTDEWGGTFEGRMKFGLEVLKAVRAEVGDDFCVGMRICGDEFHPDGLSHEDMKQIAKYYDDTGMLDFIGVVGSGCDTHNTLANVIPNMSYPPEPFLHLAAGIKEVVKVPVLHAQNIKDPNQATRILEGGYVDMVGMTRAHIADPHLIAKIKMGQIDQIKQCVGANYCIDRQYQGLDVLCIQNAATSREYMGVPHIIEKTTGPKRKVVVVGAGPAGMEAARVAAERGHDVTLFEKKEFIGGQITIAAKAPQRDQIAGITRWYQLELARLKVDLRLGTAADVATILDLRPDVVVLAVGGIRSSSRTSTGAPPKAGGQQLGRARRQGRAGQERAGVRHHLRVHRHVGGGLPRRQGQPGRDRHRRHQAGRGHRRHVVPDLLPQHVPQRSDHDRRHDAGEGLPRRRQAGGGAGERIHRRQGRAGGGPGGGGKRRAPGRRAVLRAQGRFAQQGPDRRRSAVRDQAAAVPEPAGEGYLLFRIGDCVAQRNVHAAIYDALRLCKDF